MPPQHRPEGRPQRPLATWPPPPPSRFWQVANEPLRGSCRWPQSRALSSAAQGHQGKVTPKGKLGLPALCSKRAAGNRLFQTERSTAGCVRPDSRVAVRREKASRRSRHVHHRHRITKSRMNDEACAESSSRQACSRSTSSLKRLDVGHYVRYIKNAPWRMRSTSWKQSHLHARDARLVIGGERRPHGSAPQGRVRHEVRRRSRQHVYVDKLGAVDATTPLDRRTTNRS